MYVFMGACVCGCAMGSLLNDYLLWVATKLCFTKILAFFRQAHTMLGSPRIYKSLGRVCWKLLLGQQHVFFAAQRRNTNLQRGIHQCALSHLLSMGGYRTGRSSHDDLGAASYLESGQPSLAAATEESSRSSYTWHGLAPQGGRLPSLRARRTSRESVALFAHQESFRALQRNAFR